jgi:mannose-6-phosphate isomerase-like protein (cupin superfamily)
VKSLIQRSSPFQQATAWHGHRSVLVREHVLIACSEVYFIIHGRGRMYINNEENDVQKHDTVYIPPHAVQSIENIGSEDLEFLCIVDPAWRPAVEEILDKQ